MQIDIHIIHNFAPSNPNRDDSGAPKSAIFGGVLRGRISSQSLMSPVRKYPPFVEALGELRGHRTKHFPELVRQRLAETDIPKDEHDAIVHLCGSIGKKDKEAKGDKDDGNVRTPQLIYLANSDVAEFTERLVKLRAEYPEEFKKLLNPKNQFKNWVAEEIEALNLGSQEQKSIKKLPGVAWNIAHDPELLSAFGDEYENLTPPSFKEGFPTPDVAKWVVDQVVENATDAEACKKLFKDVGKANGNVSKETKEYKALKARFYAPLSGNSLDILLLGRKTTTKTFRDENGCVAKSHAISTNEMVRETDYFTAMDDMEEGTSAAHIGTFDFTSNCYYKYFSISWSEYTRKVTDLLGGDLAAEVLPKVLSAFLEGLVKALPVGAKNSFASNTLPSSILVEVRNSPRSVSYHNAFLTPAVPSRDRSLEDASVAMLGHHILELDRYGDDVQRFWFDVSDRPLGRVIEKGFSTFPAFVEAVVSKVAR